MSPHDTPPDDPNEPAELAEEQDRRVENERDAAADSTTGEESAAHERRAEKAEYLREKLAEADDALAGDDD